MGRSVVPASYGGGEGEWVAAGALLGDRLPVMGRVASGGLTPAAAPQPAPPPPGPPGPPGPDSWWLICLSLCWVLGSRSGSSFRDSGDVLGVFAEEQDKEESEKRQKKKKGTKRKRDGRGQGDGTLADDLKLDDMLDRTLEDGAKQHNLTAVNVRNILHVSGPRGGAGGAWEARSHPAAPDPAMGITGPELPVAERGAFRGRFRSALSTGELRAHIRGQLNWKVTWTPGSCH